MTYPRKLFANRMERHFRHSPQRKDPMGMPRGWDQCFLRWMIFPQKTTFSESEFLKKNFDFCTKKRFLPKNRRVRIKNPPLKLNFPKILEISSYSLKFSPDSFLNFLFFRKCLQKNFACGAKIPIQLFVIFYLVYRFKTMQNRSKNFRLRRKMHHF